MPDYAKILEQAAGAGVSDQLALLKTFAEIGKRWAELAGKLKVGTVEETIKTILTDLGSQKVQQAFTDLGLTSEHATLKRLVGELGSAAGEVPPSVKQLLRPISDFNEASLGAANPGKIDWALDAKQDLKASDELSFSLSASGGVAIEAGDTWPYARDKAVDPLLRIGLNGKIGGSAGATVPYSLGTITGSAEASVAAQIDYYLDARQSRSLYVVEIGQSLARLPDPFDFEAVWQAFASSSLYGITFDFTGAAKAGLSVSLAHSAQIAGIAAEIGATVAAQFSLDTKYSLSFRRGPAAAGGGSEIIATLSRAKVSAAEISAKLGVTLDLAKLAGRVHALLKSAIGEWDTALKEVKPFLSPGTWLQTQAADLIKKEAATLVADTALRDAIVRDLRGALGVETSESALVAWVGKEVSGALDRATGTLTAKVDDATASAVAALSQRLPALAQANLKPKLEAALKKLIGDARKEYEGAVTKAIGLAGGDLQSALSKAGAKTTGAVKSLNDALAPLRDLITKYDKLFQKIVAEAGNAARRKITANLQLREARSDGENIEVLGTFRGTGGDAEAVFTALTRGRLDAIRSLFEPAQSSGDFVLDPSSKLTRIAKSSSEFGLELVLFNFGLSGKELLEAEASVGVDGEGNVYVDTSAKLTKTFEALSEGADLSFVDVFAIARVRALGGLPGSATRKFGAGVTVTYRDNRLKRAEVEGFVHSLEAARLVEPGSKAAALAKFDSWAGRGSEKPLAAHLTAKLWLTTEAAVRMMQLDGRTAAGLTEKARTRIVDLAVDALRKSGDHHFTHRVMKGMEFAAKNYLPTGQYTPTQVFMAPQPRLTVLTERGNQTERDDYGYFLEEQERLRALVNLFERMGAVYLAQPADPRRPEAGGWTEKSYRNEQQTLAVQSRTWLTVKREFLFWLGSEVHGRTIALLRTMAALAGVENAPPLAVVITRKDPAKGDEAFVLTGSGD